MFPHTVPHSLLPQMDNSQCINADMDKGVQGVTATCLRAETKLRNSIQRGRS